MILVMLYGHIAIGVDDIYATCEAVRANGGKVTREAGPVKGGTTVIAFVEDPDGYKIEFIENKSCKISFRQLIKSAVDFFFFYNAGLQCVSQIQYSILKEIPYHHQLKIGFAATFLSLLMWKRLGLMPKRCAFRTCGNHLKMDENGNLQPDLKMPFHIGAI